MSNHLLRGVICWASNGEDDRLVGVLDEGHCVQIFAEWAHETLGYGRRQVCVRYWTAAALMSGEAIKEEAIRELLGAADVKYGARYSEMTGYLWTDEEFNVGGHSLIHELGSHVGRFLHLELEIHK